jgi:hypothetical protein
MISERMQEPQTQESRKSDHSFEACEQVSGDDLAGVNLKSTRQQAIDALNQYFVRTGVAAVLTHAKRDASMLGMQWSGTRDLEIPRNTTEHRATFSYLPTTKITKLSLMMDGRGRAPAGAPAGGGIGGPYSAAGK